MSLKLAALVILLVSLGFGVKLFAAVVTAIADDRLKKQAALKASQEP